MKVGYYIFLGRGDYHAPANTNRQWVSTWGIRDWKTFIDSLVNLEVNTLMIYLNGHKLPFRSSEFPELVDETHPNVIDPILPDILIYARSKGLAIIAVLTTTGHAGGFSELHNEARIQLNPKDNSTEDLLVSFPEHFRQGKLTKKYGAAQLGFGVLCHNNPLGRRYAETIISEILNKYGQFFDGIALHPPETINPCYCQCCQNKYFSQTNEKLNEVEVAQARVFFTCSYLEFQEKVLVELISHQLPNCKKITFTIPWLFEQSMHDIAPYFAKYTTLIEWDYNLSQQRLWSLTNRLERYKLLTPELWFMPTAGFSFDPSLPRIEQIQSLQEQMSLALDARIDGLVQFLGPKVVDFLFETSYKALCNDTRNIRNFV